MIPPGVCDDYTIIYLDNKRYYWHNNAISGDRYEGAIPAKGEDDGKRKTSNIDFNLYGDCAFRFWFFSSGHVDHNYDA